MISAKRIINLFRQTGGGDEFTKLACEFTDAQLAPVSARLDGEEPLIVTLISTAEWFAITDRHLVLQDHRGLRSIRLDGINWVATRDDDYKARGGDLGIKLRDGSIVSINLRSGKPYVALMNVLMYVGRVTDSPTGRGLSGSPTTTDRRPTTQS